MSQTAQNPTAVPAAAPATAAAAPATAAKAQPAPAAPTGPVGRRVKKGELIFAEGETSRAMYLVKSGVIRIFKKKGDADIEIDTIHSGQILGELAFLDGNPRSASAEALSDCDLVEISGPTFQAVLGAMPEWLKIMLKTVVGRLRTSGTRIRQLEMASTAFAYNEREGTRKAQYTYLPPMEAAKIGIAILLVGSRNGQASEKGTEIRMGILNRYANQILNVPMAKITSFVDILVQTGVCTMEDEAGAPKVYLKDIDFLERYISWVNEENLLEPAKRHDVSLKAFLIMGMIVKHLPKYPKDAATGVAQVNIAAIRNEEMAATGKEPFRLADAEELVKVGYLQNLAINSTDEAMSSIAVDKFTHNFRLQRVTITMQVANNSKRKK